MGLGSNLGNPHSIFRYAHRYPILCLYLFRAINSLKRIDFSFLERSRDARKWREMVAVDKKGVILNAFYSLAVSIPDPDVHRLLRQDDTSSGGTGPNPRLAGVRTEYLIAQPGQLGSYRKPICPRT